MLLLYPAMAIEYPQCKYCGSKETVLAGTRKLKSGKKQVFKCNDCLRRFSNANKTGKHTDGKAILTALTLRCEGYSYDDIIMVLRRKLGVNRTKASISRWMSEYAPSYLDIAHKVHPSGPPVRSFLFTHDGLKYLYKYHLGKIVFARHFGRLTEYLEEIPRKFDHKIFEKSYHCSQLKLSENKGLRHSRFEPLNMQLLHAVSMAQTNKQRHQTVEDYLLYCDRNTIAVEVPVCYMDKHIGMVAGHIDILQIDYGKINILDYKPNAERENPQKVITQLSLYAIALAVRCKLRLNQIRCAYFDEQDSYWFEPRKVPTRLLKE